MGWTPGGTRVRGVAPAVCACVRQDVTRLFAVHLFQAVSHPSWSLHVGVCREDAKRPDGMTLIPWEGGRSLLWDFTSCDTLAQSHQVRAVRGAGEVANYAEEQKRRKYATLTPSYAFAPICIETLGAWRDSAKDLVRKIGARVCEKTGEPRSTSFLIQRLALDVQRGNAAAVLGTIPATRDWAEVGLLPL